MRTESRVGRELRREDNHQEKRSSPGAPSTRLTTGKRGWTKLT